MIVGNAMVECENFRNQSEVFGGSRVDSCLAEIVLQLIVERVFDRIDLLLLNLNLIVETEVSGLRCIVSEDSIARLTLRCELGNGWKDRQRS